MQELSAACLWIHAHDSASSGRQIAHNRTYEIIRYGDLELHDRLEQNRLRLCDTLLECQRCRDLEGCFVGVYRVIRAIV